MTTKINETSRLTKALLETAKDMKNAGVLGKATYEKVTMRHLSVGGITGEVTGEVQRSGSRNSLNIWK